MTSTVGVLVGSEARQGAGGRRVPPDLALERIDMPAEKIAVDAAVATVVE